MAQASRNKPLTAAERQASRLVSQERAANEHGFAELKNWRVHTKLRLKAKHATTLLLALTNAEMSPTPDSHQPTDQRFPRWQRVDEQPARAGSVPAGAPPNMTLLPSVQREQFDLEVPLDRILP